ncbi:porin [Paraburkholderia phosphatilytica]|uniref:porin n=1 Tax=Paraburkholderia phosphatilytica TaxID=2282883 RepID=UPI000E545798|nr:porin [Paraburkholderia phosphatilytica]
MKKKVIATATSAVLATFAGAAHAQSSVTLYGLIDAGISYVNNSKTSTGASSLTKFDDGVAQGSRWGLRGAEDLGGGLKAIFVLESGFNTGTGALGQGGALFGRQAYVGLSKDAVGTLTFGRQYTFNTDFLGSAYSTGGETVAGNYAYHVNDVDQLTSSRINNAVKFTSANFAGFTFGALYGFSNAAGAFAGSPGTGSTVTGGSSRAWSAGANYAQGPIAAGVAYTDIRYPGQASPAFSTALFGLSTGATGSQVRDLHSLGVGGRYLFGPATVWALWTNTHIEPTAGAQTTYNAYEIGGKYAITPAFTGSLGYTYSNASDSFSAHWHQIDASVDYALSKRTDVYLLGIYERASGKVKGVQVPAQIGSSTSYFNTSGNEDNQLAFRIGIRHKF